MSALKVWMGVFLPLFSWIWAQLTNRQLPGFEPGHNDWGNFLPPQQHFLRTFSVSEGQLDLVFIFKLILFLFVVVFFDTHLKRLNHRYSIIYKSGSIPISRASKQNKTYFEKSAEANPREMTFGLSYQEVKKPGFHFRYGVFPFMIYGNLNI